ncbi:chloride channel protein CLC-e isoform X1 [Cornus florida]|uniref:chloride channel protein CLC-e isoform X1 n=1 Tax=Cornus florida TaxID=4283 RepID=UPI00289A3313|nr:chloride channel protein CLC-e isoform X1 [Cornus florida]
MGGLRLITTACGCERVLHFPNSLCCLSPPPIFLAAASFCCNKSAAPSSSFTYYFSSSDSDSNSNFKSFFSVTSKLRHHGLGFGGSFFRSHPKFNSRVGVGNGNPREEDDDDVLQKRERERESITDNQQRGVAALPSGNNTAIISACFVGLLTGISVVVFNNAVHEIRDFFWDGIPYRGASWLREEPIEVTWERVIAVPVCGGFIVGILNALRGALEGPTKGIFISKAALEPILKTMAACITLGTGNSLGPEGPSVEIGASIAKGVGSLFDKSAQRKLSLVAAGSAAGISSGFNAAVAGCFFAIESVLWPSPQESSLSLTNTTSMVILSAVIASVVSEIGLGSEPAFTVPEYDFRSPSELPLYLLLGILCGLVSLALSRCTSFMLVTVDSAHKTIGIPKPFFPILGGLAVGLIALAYPEILYWGFENVDILLESRPYVEGLSADLLLQLVVVKIVATSLCRAAGLVGGYYAPSLFIGAATGMAYGKFVSFAISQSNPMFHLSILEVASPQAYGLVGMAATLAGVCQVPLTAVLLLFELTQDYRIVLPLLGAVGVTSWITSGKTRRMDVWDNKKLKEGNTANQQPEMSSCTQSVLSYTDSLVEKTSYMSNLCEFESSLCVGDSNHDMELEERILVSQAMKTRYVTVQMSTLLTEAVTLMLTEKQSCAVIVDNENLLIGLLRLGDIQEFSISSKARSKRPEELLVYHVCSLKGDKCVVSWTLTPGMSILSAQTIMNRHGESVLPVILEHVGDHRGLPVGILDTECISLACRIVATRECLSWFSTMERPKQ